jgi:hypothetical protein
MDLSDSQVSNVSNDAIVSFQVAWMRKKATIDQLVGEQRALVKSGKANGINTDAAIDAVRKRRRFSAEEARLYMRDLIRSMALQNMPVRQEDLFTGWEAGISPGVELEATLWDAEKEGFKAGRHGADRGDCPYSPGTEHHAVWHTEYAKGVLSRSSDGSEVAPATRERPPRGRQARIPGTEHQDRPRQRRAKVIPINEAAAEGVSAQAD